MSGLDAFGTILAREGNTPGTYVALANVSNIGGPGLSRETIDVTAHDSPNAYRQFVGGLKDPGEISFDINYDPLVHDTLVADLDLTASGGAKNWKITWPKSTGQVTAGNTWTFPAIMTGFEPGAPIDDKLSASVTLKVSGKPVLAAGS
jgi:predicted secreted protein